MSDKPSPDMGKPETPAIVALLDSRRVRRCNKPPETPPALTINTVPIAKPGDITAISAQAKSGKTAFVNGIIAAAICAETGESADTFGVVASDRPDNAVVVWIDTEQSEEDAWRNLDRAGRRANCAEDPEWIRAYYMVGENPVTIRAAIKAELERLKKDGIPIWFLVVDGITDLMNDPNSIEESQGVCTEIRAHTREHCCPAIVVIHRNEGEKAGGDARGHIGKELNRKASVVLSLEKDGDEVTTVWSHKARGAPIRRDDGPRFRWSDNAQMHVSVHSAEREKADSNTNELCTLFEGVFEGVSITSFSELKDKLVSILECSSPTAIRKINKARELRIINKLPNGKYQLGQF